MSYHHRDNYDFNIYFFNITSAPFIVQVLQVIDYLSYPFEMNSSVLFLISQLDPLKCYWISVVQTNKPLITFFYTLGVFPICTIVKC